ncbi:hypothetical protein PLICRDRAFT_171379 [Plicaturopsis crispa FD-325 SS-3]|nr:hypothetical protein PLICRDRAFT_171379 [Plicaturopsis crispa FD-325 SS-3]
MSKYRRSIRVPEKARQEREAALECEGALGTQYTASRATCALLTVFRVCATKEASAYEEYARQKRRQEREATLAYEEYARQKGRQEREAALEYEGASGTQYTASRATCALRRRHPMHQQQWSGHQRRDSDISATSPTSNLAPASNIV